MVVPWHFHSALLGCKVGTRKPRGKETQVLTVGSQASIHKSGDRKGIRVGYPHFCYLPKPGAPLGCSVMAGITKPEKKWCQNQLFLLFYSTPRPLRILYSEWHILSFLPKPWPSCPLYLTGFPAFSLLLLPVL